jgi:hypothetical protein
MSTDAKVQTLQKGYQPTRDEETRGYRVTQPVDLANLKIPTNLGDAAVTPLNSSSSAPAPAKPEKQ